MTLSRFRAEPRVGHMQRVKRLFGYVRKFPHGLIRVRTEEPDYSTFPPYQIWNMIGLTLSMAT